MKTVEKKLKRFIQFYKEIKTVKKERQRIFKVFKTKPVYISRLLPRVMLTSLILETQKRKPLFHL